MFIPTISDKSVIENLKLVYRGTPILFGNINPQKEEFILIKYFDRFNFDVIYYPNGNILNNNSIKTSFKVV